MEQFKIKSIDELDREFVENSRNISERKSKIPEISKDSPSNKIERPRDSGYFEKRSEAPGVSPERVPESEAPAAKKPRTLTPAVQNSVSYNPSVAVPGGAKNMNPVFSDGDYGRVGVAPNQKTKRGKGALAVKIISIVMLSISVFIFIFGCFTSVFLDNSPLGKICLNTLGQKIEPLGVSKGDLIVSRKVKLEEYKKGSLVVVPFSSGTGCDIQSVTLVDPISEDDAELTTAGVLNGAGYTNSARVSSTYGIVKYFVPALGGILNFAMDNAVLVCVLFVLIAAFWSLVLALVERSSKFSRPAKMKTGK